MDNYFRNNCGDQHRKRRIRAYVATYQQAIAGYYLITAASHPPENVSEEASAKFGRVKATPCIYLGRIAVDHTFQKSGVGRLLMLHAIRQTLLISDFCGVYALTLDAVDKKTAEWYQRIGFEYFLEGELAMFMTLAEIQQALK